MSEKYYRGKITYINNDKQIATIEYITGNKSKNIQAIIDDKQQEKYVQLKLIKKPHRFLVGDNVKFIIKRSSAGVFFADHVLYEFNNALEVLINKAQITNKFLGYIKKVDDQYCYVKIEIKQNGDDIIKQEILECADGRRGINTPSYWDLFAQFYYRDVSAPEYCRYYSRPNHVFKSFGKTCLNKNGEWEVQ